MSLAPGPPSCSQSSSLHPPSSLRVPQGLHSAQWPPAWGCGAGTSTAAAPPQSSSCQKHPFVRFHRDSPGASQRALGRKRGGGVSQSPFCHQKGDSTVAVFAQTHTAGVGSPSSARNVGLGTCTGPPRAPRWGAQSSFLATAPGTGTEHLAPRGPACWLEV